MRVMIILVNKVPESPFATRVIEVINIAKINEDIIVVHINSEFIMISGATSKEYMIKMYLQE